MAMFIWGISWPSAKIVGRYADADLLMFWRFVIGAITMLPIMHLLKIWEFNFQDLSKSGNLFFIIAAVVWAGATICTQKAKSELNAVNFSLWLYLVAIIIVLPITPLSSIMNVFSFDWIFWINFLVISSLSLGFGTTIFFLATMNIGSHKTSSFMYVVPISAVASSVLFLGEPLALSTIFGGGFAILGVYLINQR